MRNAGSGWTRILLTLCLAAACRVGLAQSPVDVPITSGSTVLSGQGVKSGAEVTGAISLVRHPRLAKVPRLKVQFIGPENVWVDFSEQQVWQEKAKSSLPGIVVPSTTEFCQGAQTSWRFARFAAHPGLRVVANVTTGLASQHTDRQAAREFLEKNAVPFEITEDDLKQLSRSRPVHKVIYLPHTDEPRFETLRWTSSDDIRQMSGIVEKANRLGTPLLRVRLGGAQMPLRSQPAATDVTQIRVTAPAGKITRWVGPRPESLHQMPAVFFVQPGQIELFQLSELEGREDFPVAVFLASRVEREETRDFLRKYEVTVQISAADLDLVAAGKTVRRILKLPAGEDFEATSLEVETIVDGEIPPDSRWPQRKSPWVAAGTPRHEILEFVIRRRTSSELVQNQLTAARMKREISRHRSAEAPSGESDGKSKTMVTLIEKDQRIVPLGWKVTGVDFNPDILDAAVVVEGVEAPAVCGLALRGINMGVTTVAVYDDSNRRETLTVWVKGDTRVLQAVIEKQFPDSKVETLATESGVVLSGSASSPGHVEQIGELAEQFYASVLNHIRYPGQVLSTEGGSMGEFPVRIPVGVVLANGEGVAELAPSNKQRSRGASNANADAQSVAQSSPVIVPRRPGKAGTTSQANSDSDLHDVLREVRSLRAVIQELRTDVSELRGALEQARDSESRTKTADADGLKPGARHTLNLWLDKSEKIEIAPQHGRIVRVNGFDPDIVSVAAVAPDALLLSPTGTGVTEMTLTLDREVAGGNATIELEVFVNSRKPVVRRAPRKNPPKLPVISMPEDTWPISVVSGQQRILIERSAISRIAIAEPRIADVVQFTPFQLGIVGVNPGVTSVTIWLEDDPKPSIFRVQVLAPDDAPATLPAPTIPGLTRRLQLGKLLDRAIPERFDKALVQKVSLHFESVGLDQVLRHLQQAAGVNLVIDQRGLEEEGVTTKTAVSIDVDGVSVKSAMNLILEPLNLGWEIRDEVIHVTSQLRLQGPLVPAAYPVSDLMNEGEDLEAGLTRLQDLITRVAEPDSWVEVGGQGAIHGNATTRSLVIRQTRQVHMEIAQLLSQLRRLKLEDSAEPTSSLEAPRENAQLVTSDPGLTPAPENIASNSGATAGKAVADDETDKAIWEQLGVRLVSADANAFAKDSRYRGGMRVTQVRVHSPADSNGLQEGDVIVGLHVWETLSRENVDFVLKHARKHSLKKIRFYCLRGSRTLWGNLALSEIAH